MKNLSKDRQQAAKAVIFSHARPLEQAFYRHEFESVPRENVLSELARFQNADGGFGQALEPDFRAPESSSYTTGIALDMLRELDTPADHPLIRGAMAYLLHAYQRETQTWRIIPPTSDASPHAPWWNQDRLEETFKHFRVNPKAELVSYFYRYDSAISSNEQDEMLASLLADVEKLPDAVSVDELLCLLRLHACETLPAEARRYLRARLPKMILATVEMNPEKWGGYCLKPLWAVTSPNAPFADIIRPALEQNLDYEIERQNEDGSWSPNWSWFGQFPEEWPTAEREWRGVLTVRMLRTLKAFGRVE